jgi:2-polyprenyl-6-methoxyphenol hydroxylase-like FAD-dependent oxidoreductase
MNYRPLRVIVVGAGPIGLTLSAALARRGHHVVAIDQDPGPAADGSWRRRGVMQFGLAHGFRYQVHDLLLAEWPAAWERWRALGAELIEQVSPIGSPGVFGVRSRRSTYERALRRAAADVDGLTVEAGRVGGLLERGGRVVGVDVEGQAIEADLVVDAGGRTSRLSTSPVPHLTADTGIAHANRTYQRRRGARPGPLTSPIAWFGAFAGYQAYVFPHEADHVSVVFIRPATDGRLGLLRDERAFDAATRAIPGLASWVDPAVATPTGRVLVGNRIVNQYRRQHPVPGVVAIGDAVASTAPTAGRGVAMGSMQIAELLRLLDEGGDPATVAEPFGVWCDAAMRPWVEDHLANDEELVRRMQGHDLDLGRPLTSNAIVAAAAADARIGPHLGGYLGMTALPASLAAAERLARPIYETGWRPPTSPGPSRDDLLDLLEQATLERQAS